MTFFPEINSMRLWQSLEDIGKIGAFHDSSTDLMGVRRLTLSREDKEARELVISWLKEEGLAITIDQIGNFYARRKGMKDDLAPVMIGSHLDSVPSAGRFDGTLGVLGGLEVIRTLNENKIQTKRPVVIGNFTNEEGVRFLVDMLGSAVANNRIPLDQALNLKDGDGLLLSDELEKIGFAGEEKVPIVPPHAFLECHIEQGPILAAEKMDIGVVIGVQAISWFLIEINGTAAHAGSTPMNFRKDAARAAAMIAVEAHRMTMSGEFGPEMRTTMGSLAVEPNAVNVVASKVTCSLDLRNPEDENMKKAEMHLKTFLKKVAEETKTEITYEQTVKTMRVNFDPGVQELIAESALELDLSFQKIIAGAGHDAQEFAPRTKTAMIFVPGLYEGISHNPREYSTPEACANGVNVLLRTAMKLAEEEG